MPLCSANNPIAVIGIDAQFGERNTIDKVERALYLGDISTVSSEHYTEIDIKASVDRMAQANGIDLANIQTVIIKSTSTLALDNTLANSFTSLDQALVTIKSLLEQGEVVALIGVNNLDLYNVDLSPDINKAVEQEKNTISFDHAFNEYQPVGGIASLLLCSEKLIVQKVSREKQASIHPRNVYAWLSGIAYTETAKQATELKEAELKLVIESAITAAKLQTDDIGLLEVSALAKPVYSQSESVALLNCYNGSPLTTALTSTRSITGEGAGFSQILGLLRTVIALQQSYIPSILGWEKPTEQHLDLWQSSSFYCAIQARPWYPNSGRKINTKEADKRHAAYSCLTETGYSHIVISEHLSTLQTDKAGKRPVHTNGFIASSALKLILLSGNSEDELQYKLQQLQTESRNSKADNVDLTDIAIQCYQSFLTDPEEKYTLSLLADSAQTLQSEIQLAVTGIKRVFSTHDNEWKTPKGSYFTKTPVATKSENSICFMYPGIGATYVGLGRDLFHLFPEIYPPLLNLTDDLSLTLKDKLLNPRSITKLSFEELKQNELRLRASLADIAEAGVGFSCVFTQIFEQVFKVKADFATGYSMGEVSMYAALGCWQQPGLMSDRLMHSTTFNQQLCGDLLTLRKHWQLDLADISDVKNENNTKSEKIQPERLWETYTIKATLAEVEQASIDEPRVYCTIINTPDSVVLAGYPAACLRVINTLGVRAMPLNMANAIHSPPAKREYNNMVELYTMAVNTRIQTKMYSSSCYLPIPQLSKTIAHSIAKCLCERVDFPRLISALYDRGARIFIEMGPGRSLSSWVDKIIEPRMEAVGTGHDADASKNNHVSVPVNAKGTSDELTYFRAIAKLTSQGVMLDLNSLFYGSIIMPSLVKNNQYTREKV